MATTQLPFGFRNLKYFAEAIGWEGNRPKIDLQTE